MAAFVCGAVQDKETVLAVLGLAIAVRVGIGLMYKVVTLPIVVLLEIEFKAVTLYVYSVPELKLPSKR
jgi:hypothetical protein